MTNRLTIYPLLVRTLHPGGAALSSAPTPLKHAQCRLLEGQIDGDVFRYDDVRTPCMMGGVGFSTTGCSPGVLKPLTVIPRNDPVRPGARGTDGGRGHEPCEDLLAILCPTERQQSSLEGV
jgi:hypothetical protein